MKVVEKVSWLMGRVQGNLFPHLSECLKTPLTDQEKRLDRQVEQSAEEAIKELPVLCDRGTKKNAKGYKT